MILKSILILQASICQQISDDALEKIYTNDEEFDDGLDQSLPWWLHSSKDELIQQFMA